MMYYIVKRGCNPEENGCKYLAQLDKTGLSYTTDIDDAIAFDDSEACLTIARAIYSFQKVDVYSVEYVKTLKSEYVW